MPDFNWERLEAWIRIMDDLDLGRFGDFPATNSELGPVRLFQPCIADSVRILGSELETVFGELEGRNGVEFREETVCRSSLNIAEVLGNFKAGNLVGRVEVKFTDGSRLDGILRRGALQGLVRTHRCPFDGCYESEDNDPVTNTASHLHTLTVYHEGRPDSLQPAWWFPVGGGAISCWPVAGDGVGQVLPQSGEGEDGEEGEEVGRCGYLYPDLTTGLVGVWRAGRMVEAREGKMASLAMRSGIMVPEFVLDTKASKRVYSEDISTGLRISSQPLLTDPYEDKSVYVAESVIPGAGHGLFARRDLNIGDLVALYNGVRMKETEAWMRKDVRRSQYKIQTWHNHVMDIPREFQSPDVYSATLGHKANHAPNSTANGEFLVCSHPRFGEISCIKAIRPISAGREILIDYGYVERYVAQNNVMDSLLQVVKQVGGWEDTKQFKKELKGVIGYVRRKVNELKPLVDTYKMLRPPP